MKLFSPSGKISWGVVNILKIILEVRVPFFICLFVFAFYVSVGGYVDGWCMTSAPCEVMRQK